MPAPRLAPGRGARARSTAQRRRRRLVDFGLHFFHLAQQLLDNGHGPYYYLPKMESHLEARLWNDVFTFAEDELGSRTGRSGPPC